MIAWLMRETVDRKSKVDALPLVESVSEKSSKGGGVAPHTLRQSPNFSRTSTNSVEVKIRPVGIQVLIDP
jgi:hypothetical protein